MGSRDLSQWLGSPIFISHGVRSVPCSHLVKCLFEAFVYHERNGSHGIQHSHRMGCFQGILQKTPVPVVSMVSASTFTFSSDKAAKRAPTFKIGPSYQLCSKGWTKFCTTDYPNQVSLEKGRKTSIYGQTQPTSWSQASSSHSAVTNHWSAHQLVARRET